MVLNWPLVGRDDELDFIREALQRRDSAGVVLAGSPGVGKTRLASEAISDAESMGYVTQWAVATQAAASIPFGALASLLPPRVRLGANQLDLLRLALQTLADRAGSKPLVLAIDDAHLLDDASAAFLLQVAMTRTAFVLITLRSGASVPDSVAALWKEGLAQRLELQSLSQAEVEDLLTVALGGHVSRATLYDLSNASQGNPLLLRELVLWGFDSRALVRQDGVWRWVGSFWAGPRLVEVIESRLGQLSSDERGALETLALGEPLAIQVLESLAASADIEAAERKGLIDVFKEENRLLVRLAHPLYAEVVRGATPTVRARDLMRKLADTLEGLGAKRQDDVLRLATWRLEVGGATHPEMLTNAAFVALGGFDFSMAERLARAAVQAGGDFEAHFALGDALRSQGKSDEAEEVLADVSRLARNDDELTQAAVLRAYNLFFGKDRASEAENVILQAEMTVSDAAARDMIAAQRAILALYAGEPLVALEASSEVLERPGAADQALAEAILAAASAEAICGQTKRALSLLDRGQQELAELTMQSSWYAGQMMSVRFLALWLAGRLEEAESLAEATYQLAVAQRSHDGMAILATALGQAALARGKVRTAADRYREAAALLRERDRNRFLPWCLGALAQSVALAGDLASAETLIEEAEQVRPESIGLFAVEFELAKAWIRATAGEESRAREIALAAADAAAKTGQKVFEARALHDVARLGDPSRVSERLAKVAGEVDGREAPAFAAHVRALLSGDADRLDEVARDFYRLGALLLAAEASVEAARAHRRSGKTASALASSERARVLIAECEGASTPSLALVVEPSPLTRREQEVATLAAKGLSSRKIAERLSLSVRTIENHLQSVYSKLGVNSRNSLGFALTMGEDD